LLYLQWKLEDSLMNLELRVGNTSTASVEINVPFKIAQEARKRIFLTFDFRLAVLAIQRV